jgi:hypothetical protein
MRKEVLISILVGLILGLIITYGFYMARSGSQTGLGTKKDDLENSPTVTPEENAAGQLKITNPADGSLTTNSKIQVTGQTTPNVFVVVSLADQVLVTTANDQGAFTQDLNLKSGGNTIIIQATDENGHITSETRTVILEDASLTASGSAVVATPSPTIAPSPTSSKTKVTPKPTASPTVKPQPTIKP